MSSKKRHEGYLLIDNRDNEGLPAPLLREIGLPKEAGQGLFEAPTYTCSHCHAVVILNPDRSRPREYCRKCDHYICDKCAVVMAQTKECRPFKKVIDEVQNAAAHGKVILPGDREWQRGS